MEFTFVEWDLLDSRLLVDSRSGCCFAGCARIGCSRFSVETIHEPRNSRAFAGWWIYQGQPDCFIELTYDSMSLW